MRYTLLALVLAAAIGGCASNRHASLRKGNAPLAPGAETRELPVRATNPYKAMLWRQKQWADENGNIAPDGWKRASMQRDMIVAQTSLRGLRATAGIEPGTWVERGPSNVGGRTRSLLIDPNNPDLLWAGAVSGGIWHSTDRGATWSPVDDQMSNLAICCMASHPTDPNKMWAGTGEGFFNGDAIRGKGIFRSLNGGTTWSQLSTTASWENVNRIAINANGVMLASLRFGGIRRSVGGVIWSTPLSAQGSFFVAFDPTDGTKAIAHVMDYDTDWYHKAVYSTNAGQTWQTASGLDHQAGFDGRIELAYAPSDPSIVYASCAADGSVWRSTDGGQSYAKHSTGSFSSAVSWYANPIWVDPTNPDIVVTGGYNFYRSTDGGQTFSQISDGYMMSDQPHVDLHYITNEPGYNGTTNRRVYVCTDGGMWCTDDIHTASTTSGWYRREQSYRTTQFYGAAGDGAIDRIIGGTQDNGTLTLDGGSDQAVLMFGGDGGFCAIDPEQPRYCYGEYINLYLHRSTNGGQSADWFYGNIADAGNAANFIAPFILDPNEPTRLLAGGHSLWRTNNARIFWGSPSYAAIRSPGSDFLSAIAVALGNSDTIWVGQNDGVVSRTSNGTDASPTWTDVDNNVGSNPLPNRYVERIVIDPDDEDTVYVALGGFSPDNLWRTTDGGSTWTDVSGNLPSAPINGLARHPLHSGWLYAGTEVGIFATTDGGATWSATNEGPADVSVDELVFMNNSRKLLAATHGRGIFTVDIPGVNPIDFDGDGDVDAYDFARFPECMTAPEGTPTPSPPLTASDCLLGYDADSDGDVDISDFQSFQAAFTGPQ